MARVEWHRIAEYRYRYNNEFLTRWRSSKVIRIFHGEPGRGACPYHDTVLLVLVIVYLWLNIGSDGMCKWKLLMVRFFLESTV